ncbi:MAG: ArdC-like ssDNA-binding domain-containing protein [Arachnia sp.]
MSRQATAEDKAKWAVQRQEKLTILQEQLAEGLQQLMDATGWMAWLKVAQHFHTYSLNNQILIAVQNPAATQVAGYRAWQAAGRQVIKGEKGISILAPVTAPRTDPDGHPLLDANGTQLRGIVGVKPATVFDISQTDGPPLPQPKIEARQLLQGQAPEGMWDNLEDYGSRLGFTVNVGDCHPAEGLTHFLRRDITILNGFDPAHAASVLAHEVGHASMHDPGTPQRQATISCRGLVEVEAESFAWLVNNDWGLDSTPDSFHYLAGWTASAANETNTTPMEILTVTANRVRTAATSYLDYRHHDQTHPVTALADEGTHEGTKLDRPTLTHHARVLHELNHSPARPPTRTP